MNVKTILPTLSLIFLSISVNAQSTGKILGTVTDGGNQKIIDAATISLLKAKDSSLVKLSLTDKEGHFSFENLKGGNYLIMASSIGHRKVYSNAVTVTNSSSVSVGI